MAGGLAGGDMTSGSWSSDQSDIHIVQLPFPSTAAPHDDISMYYRDYERSYREAIGDYFVPAESLWEMPLWVAHLAGMLETIGASPRLCDMSRAPASVDECLWRLLQTTRQEDWILLSPLAQNFDLATQISRALMRAGRRTVLGGNMSTLATSKDATVVHVGRATPTSLRHVMAGAPGTVSAVNGADVDWLPSYRLLESYRDRVPLLRLNASHGCLYACDFCGDVWSRSLVVVPREALEFEVCQFERLFPSTRLIYIGDKTFGQSRAAVENLLAVFRQHPGYKFIVQTHSRAINERLIDEMSELGVIGIEVGFESASAGLLRENHKVNRPLEALAQQIAHLKSHGIRVVLNVLGGLPAETSSDHAETVRFIGDGGAGAWLYNLYNFVPYPLTPLFPALRARIFDWDFSHWREDGPPIFRPYYVNPTESFQMFLEKVSVAHRAILCTSHVSGAARG
jgi:hypothetical protein